MKPTVLITGVSGLLGAMVATHMQRRFRCVGLYRSHPVSLDGVEVHCQDLLDYAGLRRLILEVEPDVVVHCASRTDVDGMEQDREGAWTANVLATRNVKDALRESDAKLIYISSDSVYSGEAGPYGEAMAGSPRNEYGRTKLEGERVAGEHANSLILRTNIFGWNARPKFSLGEWFLDRLERDGEAVGFQDALFNSMYTRIFAETLEACIERDLTGVFNCASRNAVSKYDFGCRLAERFGYPANSVKPGSLAGARLMAPRGLDMSLDVSALEEALGQPLPTIEESLDGFLQDRENGLADQLRQGGGMDVPGEFYPREKGWSYGRQFIDRTDINAVVSVLKSSRLTQGEEVVAFEGGLRAVCGAGHAVAVNSGTAALHLACLACDVSSGHEVVTAANTFLASANCAAYCGARPVFVDIDPITYNMPPEKLAEKITARTRAVIPVHFAGQSCDMQAIRRVVDEKARQFGSEIAIIEDASHALGSEYLGEPVGMCTYSDMTVFSFHPVKHITTGEGGAVTTNSGEYAKKLSRLRSHGVSRDASEMRENHGPWYYEQIELGYNYRITDLQSALGVSQLDKLDWFKARRRRVVELYNAAFADCELLVTPHEEEQCHSNFHLYVVLIEFSELKIDRGALVQALAEAHIYTQVHYIPLPCQPYYQETFGVKAEDYPNSAAYYERCLSLPIYPALTDKDVEHVAATLLDLLEGAR